MRRGGASSGASRTKRRDVGMLTVAIALRIGGMRSCSVRSCSGRTKRALKILSVWVSSWCVYVVRAGEDAARPDDSENEGWIDDAVE
jgi:hypothetical protein